MSIALVETLPINLMDNVVEFKVVSNTKEIKYNKDGTVKKIPNNSVIGKSKEVFAFKTREEIADMIRVFDKHISEATNDNHMMIAKRNKLMFIIGLNVGVRGGDLGSLKWNTFFEEKDGEYVFKDMYILCPEKTKNKSKYVKLFFNQAVRTAITEYVNEYPIKSLDDFVFPSRKGNEGIERNSICKILKATAKEAGIKQNIGSHSLRKSFGFWCWHDANDKDKALVVLQMLFNHDSTQTTLRYIGVMANEIEDMFNSIDLGLECL